MCNAIDISTLIYLALIKHYDPLSFSTAIVLLLLISKNKTLAAAAIMFDFQTFAAFLGYAVLLFVKPCGLYTFAVIVSIVVRLLIVSVILFCNVFMSYILLHFDDDLWIG